LTKIDLFAILYIIFERPQIFLEAFMGTVLFLLNMLGTIIFFVIVLLSIAFAVMMIASFFQFEKSKKDDETTK